MRKNFVKKDNMKKTFFVILIVALLIIMYNYFNKSIVEGMNVNYPSNFCTIVENQNRCSTNWMERPWFANNDISSNTLPGNPCSWNITSTDPSGICQNNSLATGWGYTFTGAPFTGTTNS